MVEHCTIIVALQSDFLLAGTVQQELKESLSQLQSKEEKEIVKALKNVSLQKKNFISQVASIPPKKDSFLQALSSLQEKSLLPIKEAMIMALANMRWKIDDGAFYLFSYFSRRVCFYFI